MPKSSKYLNKVVSASNWKHYLGAYYLFNLALVLIYPLHRFSGLKCDRLQKRDWLGYPRERTILITFVLLSVLRYKKYCTIQHAVVNTIFYAKICVLSLYFIIAEKFFVVYGLAMIRKLIFWFFKFNLQSAGSCSKSQMEEESTSLLRLLAMSSSRQKFWRWETDIKATSWGFIARIIFDFFIVEEEEAH